MSKNQLDLNMGSPTKQIIEQYQYQQIQQQDGLSKSIHCMQDQYQFYPNSKEIYQKSNKTHQQALQNQFTQPSQMASESMSGALSNNYEIFSQSKPFFHSPQISSYSKYQNPLMNFCSPQLNQAHLQPQSQPSQPKRSINFNQIEQLQYFPQLNLQQQSSTCSVDSNTTPNTPLFDTESLYQDNNFTRQPSRSFQIFNNPYQNQKGPIINFFTKNNHVNNNHNHKQPNFYNNNNQSYNHIQQIKNKLRKQSFNSSASTCDDSTDYQFRARSGSYQSSINNHFNNPNKKKQIEDKCQKKQKRNIKRFQKQNANNGVTNNERCQSEQIYHFDYDQLHNSDDIRITNEDLISTHQEQMKEEQNHIINQKMFDFGNNQNEDDKLNISEREEEIENLEEITLEAVHKQNYGCSMLDRILDENTNEEDFKADNKSVTSVTQNTQEYSQNDLDSLLKSNIASKNDFERDLTIKNTEIQKSHFSKITQSKCLTEKIQINDQKAEVSQQEQKEEYFKIDNLELVQQISIENSKISSIEEISSNANEVCQQQFQKQINVNSSLTKMKDETNLIEKQEDHLNAILQEANQQQQNPQALLQMVQKLVQQIREKDETIKNMEQENQSQQIKSFQQIQLNQDSLENKEINIGMKKLCLEETKNI